MSMVLKIVLQRGPSDDCGNHFALALAELHSFIVHQVLRILGA
jgi:hypothetical protein